MGKHATNFMNGLSRPAGVKNKVGKQLPDGERRESKLNFRRSDVIRWSRSDPDVIILIGSSLIAGEAG